MSELGRIERPEAIGYAGKRKVYLVPLVFGPPDSPAEYLEIARRYWTGARDAVYRLEDRLGICRHVFHQFVTVAGDDGLRIVAQVNPGGHDFVGEKLTAGAALEAFEDEATLAEAMDWQMCQMVGLQSPKVQRQVWEAYRDAKRRRYELMMKKIEETLGEGEAALLVVEETHELQFSPEVEVFYVAPPALDELHRWIRDRQRAQPSREGAGSESAAGEHEAGRPGSRETGDE